MAIVNATNPAINDNGKCFSRLETTVKLAPCASSQQALTSFCLVGRVIAPMIVNEASVMDFVDKTWKFKVNVAAMYESTNNPNCFELGFARAEDRAWALANGPWRVRGYSMILHAWTPRKSLTGGVGEDELKKGSQADPKLNLNIVDQPLTLVNVLGDGDELHGVDIGPTLSSTGPVPITNINSKVFNNNSESCKRNGPNELPEISPSACGTTPLLMKQLGEREIGLVVGPLDSNGPIAKEKGLVESNINNGILGDGPAKTISNESSICGQEPLGVTLEFHLLLETNARTSPLKERKFDGASASLCSRPWKLLRPHPWAIRDFPWDSEERANATNVAKDEPSEDISLSNSDFIGPDQWSTKGKNVISSRPMEGTFVVEESGSFGWLEQTSTVRELKSLIRSRSPDFIFMTELKVDATSFVRTLHSLHFYFHIIVLAVGIASGIILAWKIGFEFECIACSQNHISGIVFSDPQSHPCLLSCVYGPPYFHAKKTFWEKIMKIGDRFGSSWLILGDTNFVLSDSERVWSKGKDQFIPIISRLVNARGLLTMPIQGDRLTWDNHRSGSNHVKSALDKGLINGAWVRLFPKAVLCSFQTSNLDHCPLCLFSDGLGEKIRRSFMFESQFGKLDTLIRDLERRLDLIQSLPVGSREWATERALRNSLNEARVRKENGIDHNCNDLVRDCLSTDDQAELIRRPSLEVIRATLFAMSSTKAPRPDGMSVLFCKHYWESVESDFCEAVLDFFQTGRMHKGVNATNIVLIHKVQNLKRPNHFRPISLCNVVYKKAKTLSKAGRATLIKSVGLSLPLYAMQTTKLSNRLAAKIDGLVRDFWWGSEKGNQSLCCRILEAKYLKGKSFLDCEPKASDSWFWKNVAKSRAIIRKGACKRVADGHDTNIWLDPWIAHLKGFTPHPNGRTISAILKGGIPAGLGKDSLFWTLESSGRFSCKSAYLAQAVDRASLGEVAPSMWNKLWNSKIPERLKVLWWCILSKALPVRSVLGKRFPIEDESCPLCGMEVETLEHLFLSCNVASHLWRSSPWRIFSICDTGIRMWDWVKFLCDLKKKGINEHEAFLFASLTIDTIWRTRNDKVHNNCPVDIFKCIDTIRVSFTDHHAFLLPCPISRPTVSWSPPLQDWLKLNCDIRVGLYSICAAVVARDHVGKVIWVSTSKLEFSNTLCGEAEACCLALEEAKACGVESLILESDSRVVINALNGKESRWELDNYVSFCKNTSPFFISCMFQYVSRQCNFMAHNVAKWAFSHQMFGSVPLSSMADIIFCNDREV
uniref:Reverse transcriptase zinc-binding domain-containing protein n=1 Tax=Cannabis sativa TaxID=3483 RepID=A0A803PQ85_CANSA